MADGGGGFLNKKNRRKFPCFSAIFFVVCLRSCFFFFLCRGRGYHIRRINTPTASVETPSVIFISGAVPGERQETGSSLSRPPGFHISPLGGLSARRIVRADSSKTLVARPWLESRKATAGIAPALPSLLIYPWRFCSSPCLRAFVISSVYRTEPL